MHYCVDMYDDKFNFLLDFSDAKCREILHSADVSFGIVYYYGLGQCVCEALDELFRWSNQVGNKGNHMMRNLHQAERLVNGFLFEFRTCLDHMQTDIKRKYGENSDLWRIFKEGTSRAYDTCPEYAFTYHMRNYAQHCSSVVHGFNGTSGVGISSNVQRLQTEYTKWKQSDREFMKKVGENIDIVSLFTIAFSAFNDALVPVVQYLLDNETICDHLLKMRKWGDLLCQRQGHDIHCFHIVNLAFRDGSSATIEDMENNEIVVNATVFEWEMIYGLTNAIVKNE